MRVLRRVVGGGQRLGKRVDLVLEGRAKLSRKPLQEVLEDALVRRVVVAVVGQEREPLRDEIFGLVKIRFFAQSMRIKLASPQAALLSIFL